MVAAGISRERLPAANKVICTLRSETVAPQGGRRARPPRSSYGARIWRVQSSRSATRRPRFSTFSRSSRQGRAKPALVLGFPVGFVGAAEAKTALAAFGHGIAYITLNGRRGGSALAAAAVNALASMG